MCLSGFGLPPGRVEQLTTDIFFKTKAFEAGSRQVQEYNKASNFAERFKLNSYSSNDSSIMLPAALQTVLSLILTAVR